MPVELKYVLQAVSQRAWRPKYTTELQLKRTLTLEHSETKNRRNSGVTDRRSLPIDVEMSLEEGSDYTVAF